MTVKWLTRRLCEYESSERPTNDRGESLNERRKQVMTDVCRKCGLMAGFFLSFGSRLLPSLVFELPVFRSTKAELKRLTQMECKYICTLCLFRIRMTGSIRDATPCKLLVLLWIIFKLNKISSLSMILCVLTPFGRVGLRVSQP